jgi:hypothetical protein
MRRNTNKRMGVTFIANGQFLEDPLFGLFLYSTIHRHTNNSKGNFFFKSDRFIGKNPPTVQELKKQPENKKYTLYTNAEELF